MSGPYFFQGFRPRATAEDDDAKLLDSGEKFATLEEATVAARESMSRDDRVGLAVIFKENPRGEHEGVRFVFKNSEGTFEEGDLYWGNWECREA